VNEASVRACPLALFIKQALCILRLCIQRCGGVRASSQTTPKFANCILELTSYSAD
jgi:hypothetical protein